MHQDEQDQQIEELCAQLHALELLFAELCIDLSHRPSLFPVAERSGTVTIPPIGYTSDSGRTQPIAAEPLMDYSLSGLQLLSWSENFDE